MSRIETDPALFRFRPGDTDSALYQKLEALRQRIAGTVNERTLYMSITDGLPTADPTQPLLSLRLREDLRFGQVGGYADTPATGTVSFRWRKNGNDNGSLLFPAGLSEATDIIDDHFYPQSSLWEIYPPLVADPTLDNVSLSIPLVVG